MKIENLMMTRNLVTMHEEDPIFLAGQLMQWHGVRHIPVLADDNTVVGIVSDRDLLPLIDDATERMRLPVCDVMTHPAEVVGPSDDVSHAAAVMTARKIDCMPVVEKGRLVGILTATDIVGRAVSSQIDERAVVGTLASEIMHRNLVTVAANRSVVEAAILMAQNRVRHLPVVDVGGHLIGIVSDRDIRGAVGDPARAIERWSTTAKEASITVADVMRRDPVIVFPDQVASDVAQMLADERVGAVVVVDRQKRLLGIISYIDLLATLGR